MLFFSHTVVALTTLAAITSASRLPHGTKLYSRGHGYGNMIFDDITWTGPVRASGQNHTFTGPIEKVMAEIMQINPNYIADSPSTTDGEITAQEFDIWVTHIDCKVAAPGACDTPYVNEGIQYLKDLSADLNCGLMAGKCGMISCSEGAGITWCNDTPSEFVLKCRDLWQGAAVVVSQCTETFTDVDGFEDDYTWGQAFSQYGFNVIVGKAEC